MDLTYKILWCEDNDEWFEQISKKVEEYVLSKNLKAEVTRIKRGDFKIEDYDFNQYEIMIIDYQLEDSTLGDSVIEGVRDNKYYNDVIFYSSNGRKVADDVLRTKGLQGVFISDRQNRKLLNTVRSLIDKSLKRSENLVNIRGIVMDTTSHYDNLIQGLILKIFEKLVDEKNDQKLIDYISSTLIKDYGKKTEKFISDFSELTTENFKDILCHREFNSYMKNRLLNKALSIDFSLKKDLEKTYFKYFSDDENTGKMCFMKHYEDDIISHRNDLAHAHPETTENGELLIGHNNGGKIIFNSELCGEIRGNLIKYEKLLLDFDSMLN